MSWLITPRYLGAAVSDPDAQTYLRAVEAADGSPLEVSTTIAINAFVVGCKTDGIWNAIKASCILAGARTLAGALVPLVGTAPTPFAFLPADYDRKTGLVGNGSTKYINTNATDSTSFAGQNDFHLSVRIETTGSAGASSTPTFLAGSLSTDLSLTSSLGRFNGQLYARNRNTTTNFYATATGLFGCTRSNSSSVSTFVGNQSYNETTSSQSVSDAPLLVYTRLASDGPTFSNSRLSFYSFGSSINLGLLSSRLSALINAINAAF